MDFQRLPGALRVSAVDVAVERGRSPETVIAAGLVDEHVARRDGEDDASLRRRADRGGEHERTDIEHSKCDPAREGAWLAHRVTSVRSPAAGPQAVAANLAPWHDEDT